ncbi:MAG: SH3 domain-containing protein [Bacteroidota bacterium]|nr:SH3 domain-containing protein [Bacteroidota bacterium]
MIQSHRYTNKAETILYANPSDLSSVITKLNQGNWLGVFELVNDWYKVLTIQGEGWVKAEDAEERSPFNLHVQWSPGNPIQYVSAA